MQDPGHIRSFTPGRKWIAVMTTKRPVTILTAVFAAVFLLSFLSSCRPHVGNSSDSKAPTNVLLITVSGLCANHLGCYGSPIALTPAIDELAGKGTQFSEAYTTSDMTTPAAISLMTSMSAKYHSPYCYVGTPSKEATTIPELLQGYATCGAAGTFLLDPEVFPPAATFDSYYSPGMRRRAFKATDVNLYAINFLEANKTRPWFLWVNYSDALEPFQPPSEYAVSNLLPYDQSVSYIDSAIATLLSALDELHMRKNTLIILTAEHGEALDSHGLHNEHTGLYEEVLRVPLIMTLPGSIPSQKLSGLASILDILPTVKEILGIKGNPYSEGISLVPLINGTAQKTNRVLFAESFLQSATAVRSGEFKYIRYNDRIMSKEIQNDPRPARIASSFYREQGLNELYNLEMDPAELQNLASASKKRVEEMESLLDRWYKDSPYRNKADRPPVNLPLLTRVRMLGY